jgi:hypothetical protein
MTKATDLYIVRGTHWSVPGEPTSVHFSLVEAQAAALALVDVLTADALALWGVEAPTAEQYAEAEPSHTPENWTTFLHRAQITRYADSEAMTIEEAEEVAAEQEGDWLADMAEADVWIETVTATMPASPRAAVYINITGGVLQGATANVPLDVYAIDYDDDASEAEDDCVIRHDGEEVVLMEVGAEVDAGAVAALVAEPTRAERKLQTPTAESSSDAAEGVAGGGWFAVRAGRAGQVAGTIMPGRYQDFNLCQRDADSLVARKVWAWATVQELNADGSLVGGIA